MQRIVTEAVGDHSTGMRKFYVQYRLAQGSVTLEGAGWDNYDNLTEEGHLVATKLLVIAGVERVYMSKYELSVTIADLVQVGRRPDPWAHGVHSRRRGRGRRHLLRAQGSRLAVPGARRVRDDHSWLGVPASLRG